MQHCGNLRNKKMRLKMFIASLKWREKKFKNHIPSGFKGTAERADDREAWDGRVWDRAVLKGPLKTSWELSGASRDGMTPGGRRFPRGLPSPLPVTAQTLLWEERDLGALG